MPSVFHHLQYFLACAPRAQDFIEAEGNMELQKRRQEETNERKNAVEAFVYSLRGKLADTLAPFATEAEAARIGEVLQATEVRARPPAAAAADEADACRWLYTACGYPLFGASCQMFDHLPPCVLAESSDDRHMKHVCNNLPGITPLPP